MTYTEARVDAFSDTDFRIGRVISKSFSVFFQNIIPFTLIAGAVSVPGIAIAMLQQEGGPPETQAVLGLASVVLGLFFGPLATAIILHAAFQHMRGRPVSLGDSVFGGLARFLPLVGVMFLSTLGMMLGMLLLIVPGLILMTMWYVAVPACVVEGTGPVRSLGRSRELTAGYRWKMFGLILLVIVISVIGSMVVTLPAVFLAGIWGQLAVQLVWAGLSGGFGSVLIAVAYYYLRVAKEGVDVDQIASVFD